jgi:hypothetical protein
MGGPVIEGAVLAAKSADLEIVYYLGIKLELAESPV